MQDTGSGWAYGLQGNLEIRQHCWLLAAQIMDGLLGHGSVFGQVDGQALVAALFQDGDGSVGLALRCQELSLVEEPSGQSVRGANAFV